LENIGDMEMVRGMRKISLPLVPLELCTITLGRNFQNLGIPDIGNAKAANENFVVFLEQVLPS